MSYTYPFTPKPQFNDVNGVPLSGGFLYVYSAGTTTEITSYSDSALSTANANPIVLDSRGECNLYLADGSYKFVLQDSDAVTAWTVDNITIEDFSASSSLLSKYTVSYSDLAAAATSNTSTLFSLAAKTVIEYIVIKHNTAFSGGSVSALTIDVGDASDANALIGAFDVFQAVAEAAAEISSTLFLASFSAATNIILTATATGDNLDQLTQGSVDIWVKTKGMN